jgi:hypothetical protein
MWMITKTVHPLAMFNSNGQGFRLQQKETDLLFPTMKMRRRM